LKLLLDEMYSSAISAQLRRRHHDAVAVTERPELVSLSDRELFARTAAERRALVTNNVVDFVPLVREALGNGEEHFGLIFTDDRRLPRTRRGVGAIVRSLDRLLTAHPGEGALRNQVHWLS
jgi:hypothetical protein